MDINFLFWNEAMKDTEHLPVYFSLAITIIGVAVFTAFAKWNGLHLQVKTTDIAGVMAPLFFAATFIERAVEVVISPWRDAQAETLGNTADTKKAHAKAVATAAAAATVVSSGIDPTSAVAFTAATTAAKTATDLAVAAAQASNEADDAFAQYKGRTKQYAYAVALTLALLVAYVGVRALSSFCDQTQRPSPFQSVNQQLMFNVVDVVLSAALLAGGANGIHSIVTSITTFFDTNTQKMQGSSGNA